LTSLVTQKSIRCNKPTLRNKEWGVHVSTYWYCCPLLTFRRRNFLLNFSTPVFKMWIIQEPKEVALWNKRHFEEEKTESVQHV
jgi:hypothetical protein